MFSRLSRSRKTLSGSLGAGGEFVVVEQVFSPGILRGQVRHHHVCAAEDSLLPAPGQQGAQRGGGGQKHLGQQQADHGEQEQRQPPGAIGLRPNGVSRWER